ncbi:hypothetical protein PLICRDRAFT_119348 [Plicaturopsis crispa FD-325 SS-3]|uniref:DUF6589 domain-containing protein n=1 Tax=Plicaturopsis crispa FD-325 SS-3 TaxID=944288 RepID=A0A0C9T2L6_PLICR|nr:hypothetical protein PLICRDRAFT_119348 [Plicaturopsis crispa FD-325 SS-3]
MPSWPAVLSSAPSPSLPHLPFSSLSGVSSTSTPSSGAPRAAARKRKRDENIDPNDSDNPSRAEPTRKRGRGKRQSVEEKLEKFFAYLTEELKWTLGELLHHVFDSESSSKAGRAGASGSREKSVQKRRVQVLDDNSNNRRAMSHAAYVRHFLDGSGTHGPASVLEAWFRHPSGRHERDSSLMYSTTTPYTDISSVRPALSSFAAQLIAKKLVQEAEDAVKVASGLHVAISEKTGSKEATWGDIGATTMSHVQGIIQKHQPLTWYYTMQIAARKPRVREGVIAVRQKRPPEVVSTHSISSLNFARSGDARLLPSARGMLYFASSAPVDLFRYNSRAGNMPAYTSIHRMMRALSEQEAKVTEAHGRDPTTVGIIRLDNVQNYLLQRDRRIGRQNKLNIGIAATYFEAEGIDPKAFDLDDKRKRLADSPRKDLDVYKLLGLIDHEHLEIIGVLQWLYVLVHYVPELGHLKSHVSMLYRTRAAKQPLPPRATKAHPLATSGKNETVNTELKDALVDFFGQLGQSNSDFLRRLFAVGGDGLTYEKFLLLKEYLQFHDNEFESLETLEPVLEWWHTEWTDLNRIFETHYGTPLSCDPSTLGHSAAKIGRKSPPNLKKVDYYTGAQLAYLVLDVRMLDCWRLYFGTTDIFAHFTQLAAVKDLPNFEDLESIALRLYRAYMSSRAQYRAMYEADGGDEQSQWSKTVPRGSSWNGEPSETSSAGRPKPQPGNSEPFTGDRVLARSIAFMRDTMISREAAFATAEGDVGRLYETIKVMLFTFAGSSHNKYCTYLLETITNLEYECSPELRKSLLQMSLVNLTGKAGHFSAGDFIQEYFNRLLEAVAEKKGIEYGADFARKVISRNLHHMARLKTEWLDGVGLSPRSARHTDPNADAEVRTLLKAYRECELHSRRPGRSLDDSDVDDFQRGVERLMNGKLKKWVTKTTRARGLKFANTAAAPAVDNSINSTGEQDSDSDEEREDEHTAQDDDEHVSSTLASMHLVDGEFSIEPAEVDSAVHEYMAQFEAGEDDSDAGEDDDDGVSATEAPDGGSDGDGEEGTMC